MYYAIQPTTVISPFQVPPENKERPMAFSGETVADVVLDALVGLQREAQGSPQQSRCKLPKKETFGGLQVLAITHVQAPSRVALEVKGVSLAAVISLAREVLHNERVISGDVELVTPDSFRLIARADDAGPWEVGPYPATANGLEDAACDLTKAMLKSISPNLFGALLVRQSQY